MYSVPPYRTDLLRDRFYFRLLAGIMISNMVHRHVVECFIYSIARACPLVHSRLSGTYKSSAEKYRILIGLLLIKYVTALLFDVADH